MATAQRIVQQMRMLETQIKSDMQELLALQQAGRSQEFEELKKALQPKTAAYSKLKTVLKNVLQTHAASSSGSVSAPQAKSSGSTGLTEPSLSNPIPQVMCSTVS